MSLFSEAPPLLPEVNNNEEHMRDRPVMKHPVFWIARELKRRVHWKQTYVIDVYEKLSLSDSQEQGRTGWWYVLAYNMYRNKTPVNQNWNPNQTSHEFRWPVFLYSILILLHISSVGWMRNLQVFQCVVLSWWHCSGRWGSLVGGSTSLLWALGTGVCVFVFLNESLSLVGCSSTLKT